jgi:hypothetical protein
VDLAGQLAAKLGVGLRGDDNDNEEQREQWVPQLAVSNTEG